MMATTSETESATNAPERPAPKSESARRVRPVLFWTLIGTGAALVIGLAIGGLWLRLRSSSGDGIETSRAQLRHLQVTITAEGNIESANNCELKCHVVGGARILSIVPDGTQVEAGAELVQLDRSGFEQRLSEQKITYERAVATKIQAEQDFEAAQADVREYVEGTYLKDLKAAEAQISIARQNLESNRNALLHTERMFRKGFVTALQLEADKFAVERSQLDLDAAITAKKVLEQFTRPKTIKQLEAIRDAADARRRSEEASVHLEKAKLERIQQQLKYCVIRAPQRGMVIYGNDPEQRGGGGDSPQIEEGAMVRERQTILRLPDLNAMQVKTSFHESRIPHIRPGMAARIKVSERTWSGHVKSIANRPLPPQRYQAPAKNYAVYVSIDGDTAGLKPGMTAEVEILLADLRDVCTVPVSSIVQQGGEYYAWINQPGGPSKRRVTIGQSDDRVIEIRDGLAAGEMVIANPRATVREARDVAGLRWRLIEDDSRFYPRVGTAEPLKNADAKNPGPKNPDNARAVSARAS